MLNSAPANNLSYSTYKYKLVIDNKLVFLVHPSNYFLRDLTYYTSIINPDMPLVSALRLAINKKEAEFVSLKIQHLQ